MGYRVSIAALAALLSLSLPACAKEVRYPAAHPNFALDVPDDWSVAETPLGLELQPASKDALVVAAVTDGDRKSIDGWSRRALERMGTEGVVFDKTGSAKAVKPNGAAGADDGGAKEPAKAPPKVSGKPAEQTSIAPLANGPSYTFGGPAMVDPLKAVQAEARKSMKPGGADMPSISTGGFDVATMKPTGHFAYTGGALRGQPVDVELAVFPLDKTKRLLIEQLSGPTDARGVMIVRSLRNLTQ